MELIDNKDILFIINPNSGGKRAAKVPGELDSLNLNISYIITNDLAELEQAFRLNIEKYKAFIFVGGDGTVHEALKYLYGRNDRLLGVLPAGSGNGFARELGFKNSIKSLLRDTTKGKSIGIDILSVNGNLCINIAGLGLDSFVAYHFHKSKGRGLRNYILSTIRSVFIFKPFYATLMVDQQKIQDKFLMITTGNTRQFGNNAIISPQSKPFDGIFELVMVKPFPWYLYPIFIIRMFMGSLKDSKYISYLKVKDSVKIMSEFKKYHIDGEPKIFNDSLSVKMLEHKINVIKTEHYKIIRAYGSS